MDIKVYSGNRCKYCTMAKDYFKQIGVDFTEYNVQEDESAMQVLVDKNIMSVPFIMIDDVELIGFDKDKIDEALGRY